MKRICQHISALAYIFKLHQFFSQVLGRMSKLMVVAIDFGTTFSGYSFSLRHEFKNDPLKISTVKWIADAGVFEKTSTCILFDALGNFDSFGFEAEENYANLAATNKHLDWYFFRRFKMMLYEKMVFITYSYFYP